MRCEMPVGLALEAGKDAVGGRRSPLEDGAVGTGEVGGNERDLFLGAGQVAGRVDDGGKRCPLGADDEVISRSERLEAWRIDDRVVVRKPAHAGRILSKTKRQDAEPARRQPREPRTAVDPAFLQS